jgi:sugar (pentulose or hexulose) kinase
LDAVRLKNSINEGFSNKKKSSHSDFIEFSPIESFENSTEAYYQVMIDLVTAQVKSSLLVLEGTEVNRIFVDGGFSRSSIFMNLLSIAMPTMEIYAASMSEATALGAALAIHASWNRATFPADLIELRKYSIAQSS